MGLSGSLVQAFIVTTLLIVPLTAVKGDECEDCHSSSEGSGGYDYIQPLVVLSQPLVCGPGENIKVRLYMVPTSIYSIMDVEARLLEGDGQGAVTGRPSLDPDGQECIEWEMDSGTDPVRSMIVECQCICHYEHDGPGNKDDGTFRAEVRFDLRVAASSLRIDRDLVFLPEDGCSLSIGALGSVSDMALSISPTLQGKVSATLDRTRLQSGESTRLYLSSLSEDGMDGYLNLSWSESGVQRHAYLRIVRVRPVVTTGTDLYHEIGKYTGIAAFLLLVIGYFTGGTGVMKRWGNRLFGTAARRTKFHCQLSYVILILVVFHMLVLWYGPYRELIWIWEVVLGEIALFIMLVIAANGIWQRRLIHFIGYHNWRRVHAWGTYLATGLVVVHMLTNGTHFLWFRQMIGMA